MTTTTPPVEAGSRAPALGALAAVIAAAGDDGIALRGGDGADLLLGGGGDDLVDGNLGSDTALLGAGDDRFQWDPGDASDIVEGQGGHDQVDLNGSNANEQIDLSANGARLRLTRNVANITMDTDGVERISIRTLGGSDIVAVGDLAGTDMKTVDIDLNAIGGDGDGLADAIAVSGTYRRDVVQVTRSGSRVSVTGLPVENRPRHGRMTNALWGLPAGRPQSYPSSAARWAASRRVVAPSFVSTAAT